MVPRTRTGGPAPAPAARPRPSATSAQQRARNHRDHVAPPDSHRMLALTPQRAGLIRASITSIVDVSMDIATYTMAEPWRQPTTRNLQPKRDGASAAPRDPVIHPLYVRITHWINALAICVMIGSGWQIYNASPLFAFTFPGSITLGGWLAGAPALAFRRHVAADRQRTRLCDAGVRDRPLPAQAAADPPGRGRARCRRRADRPAQPRRPRPLQRRAEAALCRGSADRRRHRGLRLRHLEAGAAAGAGGPVRRLRRRAAGAFLRHGGDRRCSSSSMS